MTLQNAILWLNDTISRATDGCRDALDGVVVLLVAQHSETPIVARLRTLGLAPDQGHTIAVDGADPLMNVLRRLARRLFARLPAKLPVITLSERLVNGRGQILCGPGPQIIDVSDQISTLLYAPSKPREVNEAVDAFRTAPLVWRAHQCVNDSGQGYIQQLDADEAAIKNYVLQPFLATHVALSPQGRFDEGLFSSLCSRTVAALRADVVEKRLVTPVLGLTTGGQQSPLAAGVLLRPVSSEERERWATDESIELSIARDLLVADCVVETTYRSAWAPDLRNQILVQSFWDSDGFEHAYRRTEHAIAALRLTTGRELPLVFSELQFVELPWVRNRLYRRPTSRDTERRLANSPLFNRVVDAEPLSPQEQALVNSFARMVELVESDAKVQTALWVFNDERNYINLYKCYEVVLSEVGGRVNDWVEKAVLKRFSRTANSPTAIGYFHARHGRESGDPPDEPMAIAEADAIIRRLLIAWISNKASVGSGGETAGREPR